MALSETQLERVRRWLHGIPVDEHEFPSGLAGLPFHNLQPAVRDLISALFGHIKEQEQDVELTRRQNKSAHEYAQECKTTRRDEVARALLAAWMEVRVGIFNGEFVTPSLTVCASAYAWADTLEQTRAPDGAFGEKKP